MISFYIWFASSGQNAGKLKARCRKVSQTPDLAISTCEADDAPANISLLLPPPVPKLFVVRLVKEAAVAMEEDGPPPRPPATEDVVARVTSGTAAAPREEPATVANVRSLTQFYIPLALSTTGSRSDFFPLVFAKLKAI